MCFDDLDKLAIKTFKTFATVFRKCVNIIEFPVIIWLLISERMLISSKTIQNVVLTHFALSNKQLVDTNHNILPFISE